MGVVHNYPGLLAARAALGIAEGGLYPGMATPGSSDDAMCVLIWERCNFLHHTLVQASRIRPSSGIVLFICHASRRLWWAACPWDQ